MALSAAHMNFIRQAQQQARVLLDQHGGMVTQGIFYSGTPNYDNEILQSDIDANFPDSGLTIQTLADAEFAIALIKTNIENAIVALNILANLP